MKRINLHPFCWFLEGKIQYLVEKKREQYKRKVNTSKKNVLPRAFAGFTCWRKNSALPNN